MGRRDALARWKSRCRARTEVPTTCYPYGVHPPSTPNTGPAGPLSAASPNRYNHSVLLARHALMTPPSLSASQAQYQKPKKGWGTARGGPVGTIATRRRRGSLDMRLGVGSGASLRRMTCRPVARSTVAGTPLLFTPPDHVVSSAPGTRPAGVLSAILPRQASLLPGDRRPSVYWNYSDGAGMYDIPD